MEEAGITGITADTVGKLAAHILYSSVASRIADLRALGAKIPDPYPLDLYEQFEHLVGARPKIKGQRLKRIVTVSGPAKDILAHFYAALVNRINGSGRLRPDCPLGDLVNGPSAAARRGPDSVDFMVKVVEASRDVLASENMSRDFGGVEKIRQSLNASVKCRQNIEGGGDTGLARLFVDFIKVLGVFLANMAWEKAPTTANEWVLRVAIRNLGMFVPFSESMMDAIDRDIGAADAARVGEPDIVDTADLFDSVGYDRSIQPLTSGQNVSVVPVGGLMPPTRRLQQDVTIYGVSPLMAGACHPAPPPVGKAAATQAYAIDPSTAGACRPAPFPTPVGETAGAGAGLTGRDGGAAGRVYAPAGARRFPPPATVASPGQYAPRGRAGTVWSRAPPGWGGGASSRG